MIDIVYSQYYNLILYFIIYSIFGWIIESIYRSICESKLINSGFMFGPYCPIYGFGALIMVLVLQNLRGSITLLFIVSFVVLSIWEYGVGVYLEKVYHTKYWDYSDHKININGRVCLQNSIYWGILGVVFTLVIHPIIEKNVLVLQNNIIAYIDFCIGMIMFFDFILSSIKAHSISSNIQKLKVMSEKIKDKTNNLKDNITNNTAVYVDLRKLRIKSNKLKIRIYRQLRRMKIAFPTMQSVEGNKFLGGKIDVEELKKRIVDIKLHTRKLKEKVKLNSVTTETEDIDD